MTTPDITLTEAELIRITDYSQPATGDYVRHKTARKTKATR